MDKYQARAKWPLGLLWDVLQAIHLFYLLLISTIELQQLTIIGMNDYLILKLHLFLIEKIEVSALGLGVQISPLLSRFSDYRNLFVVLALVPLLLDEDIQWATVFLTRCFCI
jgi:hypothetical protein